MLKLMNKYSKTIWVKKKFLNLCHYKATIQNIVIIYTMALQFVWLHYWQLGDHTANDGTVAGHKWETFVMMTTVDATNVGNVGIMYPVSFQ